MGAANSRLDKTKKTGSGKDMDGSDLDFDSPRKDGSPMEKKLDKEIRQKNEDQERAMTPPPHMPALNKGESVIGGITNPPSPHSPGAPQSQKRVHAGVAGSFMPCVHKNNSRDYNACFYRCRPRWYTTTDIQIHATWQCGSTGPIIVSSTVPQGFLWTCGFQSFHCPKG